MEPTQIMHIQTQLDYLTGEFIKLKGSNKGLEEENRFLKQSILELKEYNKKIEERLHRLEMINASLLAQMNISSESSEVIDVNSHSFQNSQPSIPTKYSTLCFQDSFLLYNNTYFSLLCSWMSEKRHSDVSLTLLFTSSKQQCTKTEFNQCCQDQGSLLICIESEDHSLFGGYLETGYSHTIGYIKDKNCFLFTLKNPYSIPTGKLDTRTGKTAFYNFGKNYLFSFGCNEILISEYCTQNEKSKVASPQSFENDYQNQPLLFCSKEYFRVLNLEVYQVNSISS